jgi:ATP-dependent Clp protease ATP-binding subunit ClpB
LAANHTDKLKLSFLLFDEIEKASDALWQLLLGMLDKATLTLGDNRRVDLSQTVIFMTSNLGAHEITDLVGGGYGFIKSSDKPQTNIDEKVERTAVEAARRKFSPEFMNRLDKIVVFRQLKRTELESVLDIELGLVQKRVLDTATSKFLFRVTAAGREFLLQEGTDQRYGARHLKRAIERYLVYPLANLLATQQVNLGDLVRVDWDGVHKELTFVREKEGAILTPETEPETLANAAGTMQDGHGKDAPAEAVSGEAVPPASMPASAPAVARQPLQGRKKESR